MNEENQLLVKFVNYMIRTTTSRVLRVYLQDHGVEVVRDFQKKVNFDD